MLGILSIEEQTKKDAGLSPGGCSVFPLVTNLRSSIPFLLLVITPFNLAPASNLNICNFILLMTAVRKVVVQNEIDFQTIASLYCNSSNDSNCFSND